MTTGDKPVTTPFLNTPASEHSPTFSPNGRWLAYVSDESERSQIYVRGYPQGEQLPVSTSTAIGPVWRPDGRELFFQGLHEGVWKLMAVSVTSEGESLRLGQPAPLFDLRLSGPTGVVEQYGLSGNAGAGYDILPNGQRFVMTKGADPEGTREITLVQHWFEELRRLAPPR
jgi:serine/threonine-protein kinase